MTTKRIPQNCTAIDCDRVAATKGLCKKHAERRRAYGDENKPYKFRTSCQIEGCTGKHRSRGYCALHYSRWYLKGNPLQGRDAFDDWDRPFAERVNNRTDKTPGLGRDGDCWEWQGTLSGGYAYLNGRISLWAWETANNKKKQPHLFILHSCDNPKCVNPDHLREGTQRENVNDAKERGRIGQGQQKRPDVIDIDTVRRARILFAQGFSRKQVMSIENITYRSARDVDTARSFQWVE